VKKLVFVLLFVFIFNVEAFSKVRVVTTTFILSSIVKQIGGECVDVAYLIPSGANPHIFSPKPKSLIALSKADMFVGVGFGFEFWLNNVEDVLRNKKVLMLSDYYKEPLDQKMFRGSVIANPHIWLDLNFMSKTAAFKISDSLCELDNTNCDYYKKSADAFSKEIEKIKKDYILEFEKLKNVCFMDVKPAFEYLLRSVSKKSCYVLIKKGNKEPRIGDIKKAILKCNCKRGIVLYISNIQIANMMAEKLKFKAVALNPLGEPKTLNTYRKLLIYNLNQINKVSHDIH
jgi:ABC-type Zn uptake system ZnuABC Zn-binding protein ZnuA